MVNFFSRHPHLSGMLFASIFGLTFMFTKVLLEEVSPMGIIAYRFTLAIITMELLRRFGVISIKIKNKPIRLLLMLLRSFNRFFISCWRPLGFSLSVRQKQG
jgi:drug/metabolite transporter (DMT)-like permease